MSQALYIYNSLTRTKELFKPLTPPWVGLYSCGPTVYGQAHIGHARTAVTFDIVFRYLTHLNYKVCYVRNITDVGHLERDLDEGNDKVQQQAMIEAVSPMEIAQRYTNSFRKNMEQLNILPPNIEPCASGHIPEQIAMIEEIIQHGFAYITNGSVYFDVTKYHQTHTYGRLSGRKIEAMRSGIRTLSNQKEKRNSIDFALWKKATPTHIMRWPSPWSVGFPGWHIECSAIATKYLGQTFDIHGGGMDLLFPHHECEIAQTQASYQTDLATYWMHNNLITIHGVKMGKSLGNVITLNDLFTGKHEFLDQAYSPMALRFFILQAHYRSILSLSLKGLQAAHQGYRKLMNGWYLLTKLYQKAMPTTNGSLDTIIHTNCIRCYEALNNDFNTAKALTHLFYLLKIINGLYNGQICYTTISTTAWHQLYITYTTFVIDILGLKEDYTLSNTSLLDMVLTLYQQAKETKNYNQVDFMRTSLHKIGIALKDHPEGCYWEVR